MLDQEHVSSQVHVKVRVRISRKRQFEKSRIQGIDSLRFERLDVSRFRSFKVINYTSNYNYGTCLANHHSSKGYSLYVLNCKVSIDPNLAGAAVPTEWLLGVKLFVMSPVEFWQFCRCLCVALLFGDKSQWLAVGRFDNWCFEGCQSALS